jgi:hypothetical protein
MRRAGAVALLAVSIAVGVFVIVLLVGGDSPIDFAELADEIGGDRAADDDSGTDDAPPDGDDPGDNGNGDSGAPDAVDDPAHPEMNDHGPVGTLGPAMLRGVIPRLVIEVVAQDGVRPDSGAISHATSVLGSVADKPGGIEVADRGTFSSDRREWSADNLRALARDQRRARSGGDTAAIFVMYVRGRFQDGNAIGVALNASEIALFPDQWSGTVEQLVGSSRAVERAVLTHEIGHLLGLVNLTYESIHDHEDPEHRGHSRHRDSVMYWAVETTAVGQVFSGPPPDNFNDFDRADLHFLRTGEW